MSGVGSTNAMKKGSANNPFLAYSEADMQGFLNSAYTGCIVKYTGPSTKTAVPRGQKLSLGDAQNLVVDLTKNFTYSSVSYKSREWNIGIEIENSDNTKTNQCIMNIKIDSKTGIIGSGDNDIQALIYSEYTPYSSLYGKNINEISVKFLAVTSVNVDRDVIVNWPITYGKNGWQSDCFNDLGKITLWGYGETVLAYQNQNNMDYWGNGDVIYTEPYIINELYKVVYSNGQYYFEEYYHISENVTTATVEDVAPGKTFYDFTGTKQTGTGTKINPYIASTADEMAAYLTSSYKGAFVKYIGETVTIGGTSVPVNPIAVGDTITKLYFDTTKTPDFSKFDWNNPDMDNGDYLMKYFYLISFRDDLNSNAVEPKHICAIQSYAQSEPFYYLGVLNTPLFYTKSGWKNLEEGKYVLTTGNPVVALNHQDIWGEYISKDGQWTSGGGESYVKNAIYQVAEDGDTTTYMILPTLSNPGTAADLAQGKQLIDGEGKVVEGEAVKGLDLIKYANGTLTEFDTDAELTIGENCDITLFGQKLLSYVNIPNVKVISMMAFAECENLTTLNQNICANINAFYSWYYGSTKKIYPDSLVTRLSSVDANCFVSVNNNPYAIYIGGYWYINSVSSYITNNVEVLHPNFVSGSRINTYYTFNSLKCIPTGAFYSVKYRYTGSDSMTINAPELEAIHTSAIYFDRESSSYLPSLLILNASKIKYYGSSAINIHVAGVQNYNLGEYYGYGHFRLYSTDGSTSLYYNDYPNAKEWYGGNFDKTKMLNLPKATAVSIDGGIGASIPLAKIVSWYNMPTGVELPECEKLDVTYMSSNGVIIGPKVKIFNLHGTGCTEIHLPNFEGDTYLYTDISNWRSSVAHINCGTLEIIDCPRCSKYVNIGTSNLKSIKLDDNIYSIYLRGNIASNCSINLLNSSQDCYVAAEYSGGYLDITLSAASSAYIGGSGIGTVTIIDNGAGSIHGGKSINIAFSASMINYSISNNSWLENISMPTLERITLTSCPKLTDLYMPNAISNYSYFLNVSSCTSLSAIIFTKYISSIYTNYLYRTPIQSSSYLGYFGSIYVPASYVQSYKRAQGWSYYSSRITSITDLPQELKDKYGLNGVE